MVGYNLFIFYSLVFLYSLGIFIFKIYIKLNAFEDVVTCYLCKELDEFEQIYDYIIVGSGTAGSIIASRLALSNTTRILLLEAGSKTNFAYNIPAIGPLLQKSSVDWQYTTVPQTNSCLALENHVSNWPMGKLIGGTSRFHNMIYTRGHFDDYKWLNLNQYEILSYFKKTEQQKGDFVKDSKYHSTSGYLPVEDLPFATKLANATLEAAKLLGYPVTDLNGKLSLGFMQSQVNTINGQRCTTSDVLQNAMHPNVRLQTNTVVTKVLLRNNFQAYGVQFEYFGKIKTVKATNGVILSAGVVGTPKILMHSGIGPAEHLQSVDITAKIDLPVGNNLQDHVTTGLDLILLNETLPLTVANMMNPRHMYDYFMYGSGPWSATGAEVVALLNTLSSADDKTSVPDLEFMVIPAGISADGGKHFRHSMEISEDVWVKYFVPLYNKPAVTILPVVLHPKSVGTVRLADGDFKTPVLIDPNYLADSGDVDTLLRGIEIIKKLLKAKPLRALGARLNRAPFPGCESFEFDSRAYWECYVRQLTITAYHPVGTCRMGAPADPTAVVGFDFRVLHTDNLYVVDASIFSGLPSANINAPIMMMAERAADSVKNRVYLRNGRSERKHVLLAKNQCLLH